MKVLVAVLALIAVAAAQQQEAQYAGLREFIQHLMSLEQRQQRQGEVLLSNEGVPLVEIPGEGVYEIFADPSEVPYYRDPNQENYVGYNYDKVESAGKLSYHAPELSRPKRQTSSSNSPASSSVVASSTTNNNNNPNNRFSTFINNLGTLTTNIRRQTQEAFRQTLSGNPPNPFRVQVPSPASQVAAAAEDAKKPTSLNDVYGSVLGARSQRSRRHAVRQNYAAIVDVNDLRAAVERSDLVPQVAFFETASSTTNDLHSLLEEPPFAPIYLLDNNDQHQVVKRSAQTSSQQDTMFADLFRPLQEIFGIVNATAQAIIRDVVAPMSQHPQRFQPTSSSSSSGYAAISKHEFKINDREGTVIETEARPAPAPGAAATAKIHMRETFYNPQSQKIETMTHEQTVLLPILPPLFAAPVAAIQNFDPSRVTETIERIALPFQRAFTNFTTELGLSIFKSTHPTLSLPEDKSYTSSDPTKEGGGTVTLDFYRPDKKPKDDGKPFVINEENIYPPRTESNIVPDGKITTA